MEKYVSEKVKLIFLPKEKAIFKTRIRRMRTQIRRMRQTWRTRWIWRIRRIYL